MTAIARQATAPMPRWVADHVAEAAEAALLAELETWPKPGLVSHVDSGSHIDMDAGTFKASAIAITPFYGQLAVAGGAGFGMERLRQIGVEAERAMLAATGGVNTHRGAIFGLGLLCAAAGAAWSGTARAERRWRAKMLGDTVRQRWGQAIMRGPIPLHSHGTNALRQIWMRVVHGRRQLRAFRTQSRLDCPRCGLAVRWHLMIRRPLAYRLSSPLWRRWRIPICFTAAVKQVCATPRKRRPAFSGRAVSNGQSGASEPRWCTETLRRASPQPGRLRRPLAITLFLDALEAHP